MLCLLIIIIGCYTVSLFALHMTHGLVMCDGIAKQFNGRL